MLNYKVSEGKMGFMSPEPINEEGQVVKDGHKFALEPDGQVDVWRMEVEYHNGPHCNSCDESFCQHCDRQIYTEVCEQAKIEIPLF